MKKYLNWAFFPISILYCELWLRLFSGESFFDIGLIVVVLFSMFFGLLIQLLSLNKNWLMIVSQLGLSLWYSTQTVYHNIFGGYMILYSFKGAGQLAENQMLGQAFYAIYKSLWQIFILFVPFILLIIGIKKFKKSRFVAIKEQGIAAGITAIVLVITLLIRFVMPNFAEQNAVFKINRSVLYNGLLYAEILDFGYNILGMDSGYEIDPSFENKYLFSGQDDENYKPNVMDIDFDALIGSEDDKSVEQLHRYFKNRMPTNQNEYTGMFKGYNLIQITAEGFSYLSIDKELTPTLYKMQNEGFNFTNFYTPIWDVSTSDGEYAATTGLIPKSGVWSYVASGENNVLFPFSMPQQFLNDGVSKVNAYHNHTYTYYNRQITHKNLGFNYKGIGSGVEKYVDVKNWPESDYELFKGSVGDYISNDRFMSYYMTVSGHMRYTFADNSMAAKHRDKVEHLKMSENSKAYIACNIELDLAMEHLLKTLKDAGIAEKTVIVITPDHYPYGLEDNENADKYHNFSELAGHKIEKNFEIYKSSLIIYCPNMPKPVEVDKYCSSVDIIPTLNNLFGFEYDSRLLPGSDILSDSQGFVVFNDLSFISEKGFYNSKTDKFTCFEGDKIDDEYLNAMFKIVNNKFKVSARILETDYYKTVIDREHKISKK